MTKKNIGQRTRFERISKFCNANSHTQNQNKLGVIFFKILQQTFRLKENPVKILSESHN